MPGMPMCSCGHFVLFSVIMSGWARPIHSLRVRLRTLTTGCVMLG